MFSQLSKRSFEVSVYFAFVSVSFGALHERSSTSVADLWLYTPQPVISLSVSVDAYIALLLVNRTAVE